MGSADRNFFFLVIVRRYQVQVVSFAINYKFKFCQTLEMSSGDELERAMGANLLETAVIRAPVAVRCGSANEGST